MRSPLHAAIWRAAAAVPVLPTWAVAGVIWTLLGVVLLAFALLFLLEGLTYFQRQPPITFYVRSYLDTRLVLAIAVSVLLVAGAFAAVVHFVLDR